MSPRRKSCAWVQSLNTSRSSTATTLSELPSLITLTIAVATSLCPGFHPSPPLHTTARGTRLKRVSDHVPPLLKTFPWILIPLRKKKSPHLHSGLRRLTPARHLLDLLLSSPSLSSCPTGPCAVLEQARHTPGPRAFAPAVLSAWNTLPLDVCMTHSLPFHRSAQLSSSPKALSSSPEGFAGPSGQHTPYSKLLAPSLI